MLSDLLCCILRAALRLRPGAAFVHQPSETPRGPGSEQCDSLPAAEMENTREQRFNSLHRHDVASSQPGLLSFHRNLLRVTVVMENNPHQPGVGSKCLKPVRRTSEVFLLSFLCQLSTNISASQHKQTQRGNIQEGKVITWENKDVNKKQIDVPTVWTLLAPNSTKCESSKTRALFGART